MRNHNRTKIRLLSNENEQGFTLVEVMLGILIFTIGITAVAGMSVRAYDGFGDAREGTVEINRTVKNIDTLKSAQYTNSQIFTGNGPSVYPHGADQTHVGCWDFDDIVVRDVKLIAVENRAATGFSPTGNYRLYFIKEGKPLIN